MKGTVFWYVCRDGSCHGKLFYESTKACQTSLTAKVRQLEQDGRPSSYQGHQLRDEYAEIFEFTLPDHRFCAFRHHGLYYITNGANKDPKGQESDYRLALKCRNEFFDDLETPRIKP
jgi:hypothetical protein